MNKFIFILLILLVSSCRKDSLEVKLPVDDTTCQEVWCDEIPPLTSMIGWQTVISGSQYQLPEFNPDNSNEFVYIQDNGTGNTELVKFNISTNEKTVLCNNLFITNQPQWGKLGWITFSSYKKVWKIYQDGTQLTQLTFGEKDLRPNFNFDGDEIYYYRDKFYTNYELDQNPDLYLDYKMMIIDLNGNVIDSILAQDPIPNNYYVKWLFATIQNEQVFFVGGTDDYYGIYELTINGNNIQPVHFWSILNESILVHSIDFLDNQVYYTKFRKGIFKVDVSSGTETQIRIGCGMRYYDALSISSDGTKMLVEKVTTTVLNEYELDEQREIWMLDLVDGCKMEQILGE